MYKVLLVDDEINILEGIATLVNWNGCGTQLVKKAHNGLMALELIKEDPPDIVVTDIKMPGLTGVELIQQVYKMYPTIKFIILSGYDEFEYAKAVMQFNVKYYLLKPSNESKIEEALKSMVQEIDELKGKEQLVTSISSKLQNVIPKAKEQFLKEFLTNKKYGIPEWEYFVHLLEIELTLHEFNLIMFDIDEDHEFEHLFNLKEMLIDYLITEHMFHLCSIVGERIVLFCESRTIQHFIDKLGDLKQGFLLNHNLYFTAAISKVEKIDQLRVLYNKSIDCLSQRFYLERGSIILVNDLAKKESYFDNNQFNHEEFIRFIKSGNITEAKRYLDAFFEHLKKEKYEVSLVKSHCLEMYMSLIRIAKREKKDELFKNITCFHEFRILSQYQELVEKASYSIAKQYCDRTSETQCEVIRNVINYVSQNVSDPTLALSKIANDVFYMNSDYLGKLFKKEIGENFSNYLINLRVQKAIEMIENIPDVKMFEVAEGVGFGNNPRYFSQVFKKQTGLTPSEYKSRIN